MKPRRCRIFSAELIPKRVKLIRRLQEREHFEMARQTPTIYNLLKSSVDLLLQSMHFAMLQTLSIVHKSRNYTGSRLLYSQPVMGKWRNRPGNSIYSIWSSVSARAKPFLWPPYSQSLTSLWTIRLLAPENLSMIRRFVTFVSEKQLTFLIYYIK